MRSNERKIPSAENICQDIKHTSIFYAHCIVCTVLNDLELLSRETFKTDRCDCYRGTLTDEILMTCKTCNQSGVDWNQCTQMIVAMAEKLSFSKLDRG